MRKLVLVTSVLRLADARFLDGIGKARFHEGLNEGPRKRFGGRQGLGDVLRGSPGIAEAGAVVVADHGMLAALDRIPATASRGAVWEVPGEQEAERCRAVWRNGSAYQNEPTREVI